MQVALIGGDIRQWYAAKELLQRGFSVSLWGLGERDDIVSSQFVSSSLKETLKDAETVILPLPVSFDEIHLACPFCEHAPVRLLAVAEALRCKRVLGGKIPQLLRTAVERRGIDCNDYFESEELQLRNALPTAEGAIQIAMRELPVTLFGSTAAVVGYGRIGSLLAQKLLAFGMRVHVFARRRESLVQAELQGMRVHALPSELFRSSFSALPRDCRVLFNTVPVRFMDQAVLESLPRDCLLIDLASIPGGIDQQAAETLGMRSIWGTALPGKYAPETAGKILGETFFHLLSHPE